MKLKRPGSDHAPPPSCWFPCTKHLPQKRLIFRIAFWVAHSDLATLPSLGGQGDTACAT
jgi:hypothetical protein